MDVLKEIMEMKDTVAKKIAEANQRIRKSDGDLNNGDVEYIDKLSHSMKSLATICAMLEAEEGGYSGNLGPYYSGDQGYTMNDQGYSGRDRRNGYRNGNGGNGGGYSRDRDSRYNRGYSRTGEMTEHLRILMDEAPDESTRMEVKRLMDKFDQR